MIKIYSTESFLTDNNIGLEWLFVKLEIFKKYLNSLFKKLLKSDFEIRLTEIIMQIPMFLLILLFGFLVTAALVSWSEPEKGYKFSTVLTNSMQPSIMPGSVVFTSPPNNLQKGDVISFNETSFITGKETGRKLIHRIESEKYIEGKIFFLTKGDNNTYPDPEITSIESVLGEVQFSIPYLGFISLFLKNYWGFWLFLFLPVLVVVYSQVKQIRFYLSKKF